MDTVSLTLQELVDAANAELATLARPADERVSATVDARTVRFYTSSGLLARPQRQGRVALYTPGHVARLVAIKKMQVAGWSLASIASRLATVGDDDLDAAVDAALTEIAAPDAAQVEFWMRRPEPAAAPTPAAVSPTIVRQFAPAATARSGRLDVPATTAAQLPSSTQLAFVTGGVRLVFDTPVPADVARRAAAAARAELERPITNDPAATPTSEGSL